MHTSAHRFHLLCTQGAESYGAFPSPDSIRTIHPLGASRGSSRDTPSESERNGQFLARLQLNESTDRVRAFAFRRGGGGFPLHLERFAHLEGEFAPP